MYNEEWTINSFWKQKNKSVIRNQNVELGGSLSEVKKWIPRSQMWIYGLLQTTRDPKHPLHYKCIPKKKFKLNFNLVDSKVM